MDSVTIDLKDQLERARIFVSEKLYDDAKKILHKILISFPNESEAKHLIEEIRREELNALLQSSDTPRFNSDKEESIDNILTKLSADFDIDFTADIHEEAALKNIKKILPNLGPKEKIDLGIAFLVIDFFKCAIELFSTAARYERFSVEATYLWAQALLDSGEISQAVALLEPFLQDLMLSQNTKVDFLYLSAQAYEQMGETQKAQEYFKKIKLLNSKYRDVSSRVR